MKNLYQNGEQYYNRLYVRFNAFIAVSLLPMAWLLLEKQSGQLMPISLEPVWQWCLLSSLLLGIGFIIYASLARFKQGLGKVSEVDTLREKLDCYYLLSIKKYFEFMLSGLLSVAGFWATANTLFLIGYIVSLIFLSLGRPTISAFIEELQLSEKEGAILLEKQPIE